MTICKKDNSKITRALCMPASEYFNYPIPGWVFQNTTGVIYYPPDAWEEVPEYITIHILAKHWPYLQKECIETNDNHYRFATGPISHHNKYTIIDFKLDKPLCE